MNDVFLDTVGMIAVGDDTDQWHSGAMVAYASLFSRGRKLVTTPLVLSEWGNASAGRGRICVP
jgi:predicted nucleic acid-binding protein